MPQCQKYDWHIIPGQKLYNDNNTSDVIARLNIDPEALTDTQISKLSLSRLSKNLPASFSQVVAFDVYIRWLDLHRNAPSGNTNLHWPNTLLHWAQSLRARGFSKMVLVSMIRSWKSGNIPSQPSFRNLPTEEDIAKAYDKECDSFISLKEGASLQKSLEGMSPLIASNKKPDNICVRIKSEELSPTESRHESNAGSLRPHHAKLSLQSPPSTYVCNRCGRKGA